MTDHDDKKKDVRLVWLLCLTAVVGVINVILNRNFILLLPCLFFPAVAIPCLYFNYSLCKLGNRRHSLWNERNACDGEPSDLRLAMGKLSCWALYILALVFALLPSF